MEHNLTLILITIIGLGVFSQWIAWILRLPAIVLFLVSGVLVGPVFGVINPSEDIGPVLDPMIGLAVAMILFEGGMRLQLYEFAETATGVKRLVSLGSVLSFLFTTLAAYYIGGMSLPVSMVLGALLLVTG